LKFNPATKKCNYKVLKHKMKIFFLFILNDSQKKSNNKQFRILFLTLKTESKNFSMRLLQSIIKRIYKVTDDSPLVRLKHFQKFPNAGDVFSLELAKQRFSQNIIPVGLGKLDETNLVLLGSILHRADIHSVVCGPGFMRETDKLDQPPKALICVRGPLTANLLEKQGFEPPKRMADPGVLAPYLFKPNQKIKYKLGIIPHYVDAASPWIKACKMQGIKIIDVFSPLKKFFSDIQKCEVLLSSSLHGLIFSHAYGKPAAWIELSDKVVGNGFKFYDYYLSLGVQADEVKRIRINELSNPFEIAKTAECFDQNLLREIMEEAIFEARNILIP